MRLNYLVSYFSVVLIVLMLSGCLGGDSRAIPDKEIKTYLGAYEINFNLTSKYDYDLSRPNSIYKEHEYSSGSYYRPAYKSETRTIVDKNGFDHFDVTVVEYDFPQTRTTEALTEELTGGSKPWSGKWTTYEIGDAFQHTYRVKDSGACIEAACWLDEKTMLKIFTCGWDIPYSREYFNVTDTLESLRTRKYR